MAAAAARNLTCCGRRGHPLIVDGAAERGFVVSDVVPVGLGWTGLSDVADGTEAFVWTDGETTFPFDAALFAVSGSGGCVLFRNKGFIHDWIVAPACASPLPLPVIIEFDCYDP
jgi:hypothetical protein